jgi:hypothetical protein
MRAAFPEVPEETDNDVREDGIAAHWLSAEIFNGRIPAVDSLSPNKRLMDEDMFDGADMYVSELFRWRFAGLDVHVEELLELDVILDGMSGTPDAWAYDKSRRRLYIADFKYGFRFVEVWYNWQLLCYSLGLMHKLALYDEVTTIEFIIVQPRSNHRDGPVRRWCVKASDLRAQWNILKNKAAEAAKRDTQCVPNPGCLNCAGRHACMALQNAALTALETAYSSVPLELSPLAIGDELRRLKDASKKMEARISGLEMQAESLLKKGDVVPGWMLAPTYARERWRDGVESQVLTLGLLYGADLAKPRKPITPAQAKKLLPAPVVKMFSHTPSTGVRLTQQSPHEVTKKFTNQE